MERLLSALAHAFVSGEQSEAAIRARAARMLGREWPWLRPVIRRYVQAFRETRRPHRDDVVQFIAGSRFFQFAWEKFDIEVQSWLLTPRAEDAVASWKLPTFDGVAALCRWLAIDLDHLAWFADLNRYGYTTRNPKLENYTYRVLAKPGGRIRLIESPKKTVKELQRRIHRDLLRLVRVHPAAHGFVEGRSIKTFVAPHTAKHVVLRMDLKDFFPSIRAARVARMFCTFGYSELVAWSLTGLCTNAAPRRLWNDIKLEPNAFHELWSLYARRHLPQGAPTSPALANLIAYRLDVRLAALAARAGATYTRYADDLAFSGDSEFTPRARRFSVHAAAIALEEGFEVNHRKTRIMHQGVRQHMAGLTVNRKPNIGRREFDEIKAILTNCLRHGPASQNRDEHPDFRAHLAGRIGFVDQINPHKGARLKTLFDRISWVDEERKS